MVKICYNLFTTMSFKQFRPGFQQESILLHRGNVENSVENVENTVESRGNNKKTAGTTNLLFRGKLCKTRRNARNQQGKSPSPLLKNW